MILQNKIRLQGEVNDLNQKVGKIQSEIDQVNAEKDSVQKECEELAQQFIMNTEKHLKYFKQRGEQIASLIE